MICSYELERPERVKTIHLKGVDNATYADRERYLYKPTFKPLWCEQVSCISDPHVLLALAVSRSSSSLPVTLHSLDLLGKQVIKSKSLIPISSVLFTPQYTSSHTLVGMQCHVLAWPCRSDIICIIGILMHHCQKSGVVSQLLNGCSSCQQSIRSRHTVLRKSEPNLHAGTHRQWLVPDMLNIPGYPVTVCRRK